MKLWHLAPLALILSQGTVFGKNYGMAGCGLGSQLIKTDDNTQILAATLNGTSGNQTFGMTSGTSNCLPANKAAALEQQQHYVRDNLENLRRDMVKGDGEYLKAYAEVLGCNAQAYPSFAHVAKAQEGQIFRAPGAMAILEATKETLRRDTNLQNACSNLI